MHPFLLCFLLPFPVSYTTDIPKNRFPQLVMQPLNCVSFLLGVAILSATLGPFVTIAHRDRHSFDGKTLTYCSFSELLEVTNSERGLETKLELTSDTTSTYEDIRNNLLIGRKMAFGDAVIEKTDAKDAKSKPSSGDIKNHSTNSCAPSSLKDSSGSRMKAGPSMDSIKLEGSIAELVLNVPNPQHIRILPSKRNPSSGSKRELKDSIVRSTLYKTNDDSKDKMLEASDEILKLLNRDYSPTRPKPPVRN